jgi:hypothetical protein
VEEKPLGPVCRPYVKGISEKFKRIWDQNNMRTPIKLNTLYIVHLSEQDQKVALNIRHSVSISIPCECGRSYICETGRQLAVRIREHTYNLKQSLLEISKFSQEAYEKQGKLGNYEHRQKVQRISSLGMFNQSDQPTQLGYPCHMHSPNQ